MVSKIEPYRLHSSTLTLTVIFKKGSVNLYLHACTFVTRS